MTTKKINTTGELREFLSALMVDVRNGNADPENALRIAKIASQVNNNLMAEAKVRKESMDDELHAIRFGDLRIGGQ